MKNLYPPDNCPMCHASIFEGWGAVSEPSRSGLSAGKAAVGGIIAGPVGAIVGAAMGKKTVTYHCRKCGWTEEFKPWK